MPDIDNLSIRIESSVDKALPAFNKLIESLTSLNSSLTRSGTAFTQFSANIGAATTQLKALDSTIKGINVDRLAAKLQTLQRIDLSNLNKTLNFDIKLDGASQVQKSEQAFADASERMKSIADSAANEIINKYGVTSKALKAEISSFFLDIAKYGASDGKFDFGISSLDEIGKKIVETGTATKESVSGNLDYAEMEWKEFFDFINKHKIQYTQDVQELVNKSQQLIGHFKESGVSLSHIFNKSGGTNIDKSWGDLKSMFPNVIEEVDSLDKRISQVVDKYLQAKDMFSKHSLYDIKFDTGSGQSMTGVDAFWEEYSAKINEVSERAKLAVEDAKAQVNTGKIFLDVGINEEKVAADIQAAITRAAQVPIPISPNLKIDTSKIREAFTTQLGNIDASKITGIADALRGLNVAATNIKTIQGIDLKAFTSQIAKLSAIDPAKLEAVGTAVNAFASSLAIPDNAQAFAESLQTILPAITGFARKNVTTAIENMPLLGDAIARMLTSIASAPQINASNVQSLVALSQLKFSNLSRATKSGSATGTNDTASSVNSLTQSLGKLGSTTNRISGSVLNLFRGIGHTASSGIKTVVSNVSGLTKGLGSIGNVANNATAFIRKLTNSFWGLYAKIFMAKRIISLFTTSITKSMNYIESYHYFDVAVSKIADETKDSWAEAGYESAESYADSFRSRMLELNEKMTGYVFDENGFATATGEKSLGLDSDQMIQYQAQYAQMADSLGMTGEAAVATSKALTMLAGDWSSLRNISFDVSYQKMTSALAGQSRAVRALGIDITQAALAETAANIGIETSIQKMSQSEKAMLRVITMINQSKVAWGDLAKTLNTPANQMRMLQQNAQALARTLGNLFLPVVAKIIPYVNGLVIALQRLLQWIAAFLGLKIGGLVSSSGGLDDSLGDLGDTIDDIAAEDPIADLGDDAGDLGGALDDANESAKKLQKTILSFDELHVLNSPQESSGSGSGGNGGSGAGTGGTGGIGTGLSQPELGKLNNALLDALGEYEKAWNAAFESMASKAHEIAAKLEEIGRTIWDFIENQRWKELGTYLAGLVNGALQALYDAINWEKIQNFLFPAISGLAQTLNSLIDGVDWASLGGWIAGAVNTFFGAWYTWFSEFDFHNLGIRLMDGLRSFINGIDPDLIGGYLGAKFMAAWEFLLGVVENFPAKETGEKIAAILNRAIEEIIPEDIGKAISGLWNDAVEAFKSFILTFDPNNDLGTKIGTAINTAINGINVEETTETINMLFKKAIDEIKATDIDWNGLGHKVAALIGGIHWLEILSEVKDILLEAFGGFLSGVLSEALGGFGESFADEFVEGVRSVIDLGEATITAVATALGKLAEVLNKMSPDTVELLGQALGTFFAFSIASSLVTNFARFVTNLKLFKLLLGGGALAANVTGLNGAMAGMSAAHVGGLATAFGSLASAIGLATTALTVFEATSVTISEDSFGDKEKFVLSFSDALTALEGNLGLTAEQLVTLGGKINEISTADNWYQAVEDAAVAFSDVGVSAEELSSVLGNNVNSDMQAVIETMYNLESQAGNAKSSLKISDLDSQSLGYEDVKEAIREVGEEFGTSQLKSERAIASLRSQDGTITTATGWFEALSEKLGLTGEKAEEAERVFTNKLVGSVRDLATEAGNAKEKADPLNAILDSMASEMSWSDSIKTLLIVGALKNLADNGEDADGKLSSLSEKMDFLADKTSFQTNVEGLSTALQNAGVDSGAFYDALVKAIENTEGAVPDSIANIKADFESSQNDLKESAKNTFAFVGDGAKEGIDESIPLVEESSKNLAKDGVIAPFIEELGIHSPSTVMHDHALNAGKGVINGIDESVNPVKESSKRLGTAIPDSVVEGIDSATPNLISSADNLIRSVSDRFVTFGETIKSAIGDLYSLGMNIGTEFANGLSNGLNNAHIQLPHFSWDFSTITYGDGGFFQIPNISVNWYAKGGLFTQPTLAGFGEAGAEAALPLTNKAVMSQIAHAITDSGGYGMSHEDMVEAVATGVAMAMSQNPQTVEVLVHSILKTNDETLAQSVERGRARLDMRYNATPQYGY